MIIYNIVWQNATIKLYRKFMRFSMMTIHSGDFEGLWPSAGNHGNLVAGLHLRWYHKPWIEALTHSPWQTITPMSFSKIIGSKNIHWI